VSRQIGHVGRDGLVRAKSDGRPKTHNNSPLGLDPANLEATGPLWWNLDS